MTDANRERKTFARKSSPADHGAQGSPSLWALFIAPLIGAALVLAAGFASQLLTGGVHGEPQGASTGGQAAPSAYAGSETCAGCHRSEAELWHGSHHKKAMDHATEKTVLGNFGDASFDYYGVRSRFFRKDGKFFVETDGADGKIAQFEVKYTFGVYPLQQYLVEFPDGRIQALSLAWDSRPKEQGGQRWFHLYPNEEIRHGDVLHWTKLNQNWNFMCSECHSTGVRKNYDAANDRFATSFAEISVGCETCHGPGSRHIGWAQERQRGWPSGKDPDPAMGLDVRFNERRDAAWQANAASGNAVRSRAPQALRTEVETCGLCHARRSQFSEAWAPGQWLAETHMISGLNHGHYTPDGQMLDEVYNYGPFKQSKMFAAGVTCSDCHDPHSAKTRIEGDGLCLQCHSADKYAVTAHNRHEGVTPALTCASCHMPVRTYMVVHARHDHSFRVPRPDLSVKLGTPNACNDCHTDKSAGWAASAVERWFGPYRQGFQTYAAAFHSSWAHQPDAAKLLAAIAADGNAPDFARASALSELGSRLSPANLGLARTGLSDPDPMVRISAIDMLEAVPLQQRWALASPLLSDPVSGVRIRAASLLAEVPSARLPEKDRGRFERAAEEFIAAQRFNADRPEARSALATFYARRGQAAEAEAEYKAALRLSPQYVVAAINLADLYRQTGRESEGETVLRKALALTPDDGGTHHALGLTLVRLKRLDEALAEFRRAAELQPDSARFAYVYGVALSSAGRRPEALAYLKEGLKRFPGDRDVLIAIINFSREAGDIPGALEYGEQLSRTAPGDQAVRRLVDELRGQMPPRQQ